MSNQSIGAKAEPFYPPSVEQIVADPIYAEWVDALSRPLATELIREAVDATRSEAAPSRASLDLQIRSQLHRWLERRQQMVINATGVLIHTNLGRAPLDSSFWHLLSERLSGYGTLEFDLERGDRGKRGLLAHRQLAELAGAEAGLVVNNCAAAVLLMLCLLRGKSVIVSRGELVQIGGGFRIPDIMAQSGARMIEVGTTNKTNLKDYERAIEADTAAILSVHRSNFQMTGFVQSVRPRELRPLCDRHGLLLLEDLGSGAVSDLSKYGLPRERTIAESISDGVHAVCVSGDKLLGGPQAGLIAGKKDVVKQFADHALYRALRPDKMTLAALEITLHAHLSGLAESALPLYRLLAQKPDALTLRADAIAKSVSNSSVRIHESEAVTGGGTLPGAVMPSVALVIHPRSTTAAMAALRKLTPPVIARLHQDEIWFDLKTTFPDQDTELAAALRKSLEA
jgi:L-seryl-tRNA(Ser) seleniumtransferase